MRKLRPSLARTVPGAPRRDAELQLEAGLCDPCSEQLALRERTSHKIYPVTAAAALCLSTQGCPDRGALGQVCGLSPVTESQGGRLPTPCPAPAPIPLHSLLGRLLLEGERNIKDERERCFQSLP